jgi:short-subunit dehydrogenase
MGITKKTALITGTSRGIGQALLHELLKQGVNCIVINRKKTISQEASCCYKEIVCDLSDSLTLAELKKTLSKYRIDYLINNAGGATPVSIESLTLEQMQNNINLNLIAPLYLMKSVLPSMKKNNFGRIINLSSIAAKQGVPYLLAYSAAKSGLLALTQGIAKLVTGYNITVNAVCPGVVDTETSNQGRSEISQLMNHPLSDYQQAMLKKAGVDKPINPQKVVDYILFLLGQGDTAVNGQSINICGLLELG